MSTFSLRRSTSPSVYSSSAVPLGNCDRDRFWLSSGGKKLAGSVFTTPTNDAGRRSTTRGGGWPADTIVMVAARGVEQAHLDGCELVALAEMAEEVVEPDQHLLGADVEARVRAGRVTKLGHQPRGAQAVAAHVADREHDLPVGRLERVVPVAADVGAFLRGDVASGELEPG